MKRTHVYFVIILTAVALWTLGGCSSTEEASVNDDLMDREQVVDLNDPYGGFNLADEEPAFGDATMTEAFGPELDAEYSDPMEDDPEVARHRERNRKRHRPITYLMITWGNLEADSTIDFPTDWTGSLTADNGAICLKKKIAWDDNDEILPRTSRDTLEWVSKTRPHFDGILVALHKIAPPDTSGNDTTGVEALDDNAQLSITFDTGPLTVTINGEDLRDLHRVVKVDEAGNAVAFNSFNVYPEGCPKGYLAGKWKPVDHRPGGIFRGKWITHNGMHEGYLRGIYGPTAEGDKVFFGKWIKHNGQFQGLLVGRYGDNDAEPGGWFKGVWLKRNLQTGGHVHGVWKTRDDAEHPGGFFKGRWQKVCGNATDPE
jgi:hypothetical protein